MPVFGLVKLLLTAAVIAGAASGLRALAQRGRAARKQATGSAVEAVDMAQCPTCGVYVDAACSRGDCPLA